MKLRMREAANLFTVQGYPDEARSLYESMIQLYPEDDNIRLSAYVSFCRLARRDGRLAEADEYYSFVMMYDPQSLPSLKEIGEAKRTQRSAAAGLIAMVRNSTYDKAPGIQSAAINDMLERYPEIHSWHWRAVEPVISRLEKEIAAENTKKLNKIEHRTVDNSKGDGLPAKTKPRRTGFQSRPV